MSELYLGSIKYWLIFIRQDDQGFSRSLIERLLGHLEAVPLPHLTPNEHAHLLVLIQAMLEVRTYTHNMFHHDHGSTRLMTPGGLLIPMASAISSRCALSTFSINVLNQAAQIWREVLVTERAGARDYDIVILLGRSIVKLKSCYCPHRWRRVKTK
jgi:hypothetical protein